MKQLLAAGLVLAALLLTACGRDAKPIELPPPVEAAPVVIDAPVEPPVTAPAPKPRSKPHQKPAPRPQIKPRPRKLQPTPPQPVEPEQSPFEEFCPVGLCAAPPYRMEN
jgi:predicted small lipoprotein YifL